MKYQFITEHRQEYPISTMCRVLEVAVSGFYAWLRRVPSQRCQENNGWGSTLCASIKRTARSMAARVFTQPCEPKEGAAGASEWHDSCGNMA